MELHDVLAQLPHVQPEDLYQFFPRLTHDEYPQLQTYTWESCHLGSLGAGDLYAASEMAEKMALQPGMRVLELGAGNALSAVYFAKEYGVHVVAVDKEASPSHNWQRAVKAGVGEAVLPLRVDVRQLPLPTGYFDVIFSMNAYLYFGTDDVFLPYLSQFLKPDGLLGIVSPCYTHEIDRTIPPYLLYDPPDYVESFACHSPSWWRHHVEKTGIVEILECQEHPRGRAFWLDSIRWQLESGRDIAELQHDIRMLLRDEEHIITYFSLIGKKNAPVNV